MGQEKKGRRASKRIQARGRYAFWNDGEKSVIAEMALRLAKREIAQEDICPDKLKDDFFEYLEDCIENDFMPTYTGALQYIGVNKRWAEDYYKGKRMSEDFRYRSLFEMIKGSLANALDQAVLNGKVDPGYSIFLKKSEHGAVEEQHLLAARTQLTTSSNFLQIGTSLQERIQFIESLPDLKVVKVVDSVEQIVE